jgi:small subunit ribosomal protein S18
VDFFCLIVRVAGRSWPDNFVERRLRNERNKLGRRQRFQEEQQVLEKGRSLERNQTRDWQAGDVYAPHDLSPAEMKKWRRKESPSTDAFDALSMNPLHQYKVFLASSALSVAFL